ncbi:MAG: integron integrase [Methanobrevibacter sp.]|nr:integron integrase [Methanobrevibacter sp.]
MKIQINRFDEKNLRVTFPEGFDYELLNLVRSVSGRMWDNENKQWLIPDTEFTKKILYSKIKEYEMRHKLRIQQIPFNAEIEQLKKVLTAKHYSSHTIDAYLGWVKQFLKKYENHSILAQNEINEFLTELAVKLKVSPSTQNQAMAALLFYFRFVKNENPDSLNSVIHAKTKKHIPVVLSRSEVGMILNRMTGSKQLAAMVLYGTGIRLNEVLSLRIMDIDFEMNEIVVRNGKGGKDRRVMLPALIIPQLKDQIKKVKVIHDQDLKDGWGKAKIPDSYLKKYTGAAKEFRWQWLFPQKNRWVNPETKEEGRWHLDESLLQRAVKQAVLESGISKPATCHTLRHCFATHMLEAGYDIRTIQELLGHSDVRTTMIYTHVLQNRTKEIISPLDREVTL